MKRMLEARQNGETVEAGKLGAAPSPLPRRLLCTNGACPATTRVERRPVRTNAPRGVLTPKGASRARSLLLTCAKKPDENQLVITYGDNRVVRLVCKFLAFSFLSPTPKNTIIYSLLRPKSVSGSILRFLLMAAKESKTITSRTSSGMKIHTAFCKAISDFPSSILGWESSSFAQRL